MKFLCTRQSIYEAVINVSKAVSEKSTIPALEGIKFRLNENQLELTGYNLEIGIKTEIDVKSADKGEFVLSSRLFSEMIKKMDEEEILVEISENYQVTVSGGTTTFNLFATSSEEFPELPEKDEECKFVMAQCVLKEMINQTIFATAVTDIKPILKGELFEIEKNKVTVVAIDGYRLAVRYETINSDIEKKFVVPSKTLSEITGLLSDDETEDVNMYISPKHIIFEIGNYMVYSRLLEGEFHPYKSAIPTNSSTEVIVDRKELIATLERAMLLINDRAPAPVRCYFENNNVKIKCETSLGKISDEINAEIKGPVIEIGFKCKFLLDPLKAINEDRIKLQMGGSVLPLKIISCGEDKYTYLVLPIRLPKE